MKNGKCVCHPFISPMWEPKRSGRFGGGVKRVKLKATEMQTLPLSSVEGGPFRSGLLRFGSAISGAPCLDERNFLSRKAQNVYSLCFISQPGPLEG